MGRRREGMDRSGSGEVQESGRGGCTCARPIACSRALVAAPPGLGPVSVPPRLPEGPGARPRVRSCAGSSSRARQGQRAPSGGGKAAGGTRPRTPTRRRPAGEAGRRETWAPAGPRRLPRLSAAPPSRRRAGKGANARGRPLPAAPPLRAPIKPAAGPRPPCAHGGFAARTGGFVARASTLGRRCPRLRPHQVGPAGARARGRWVCLCSQGSGIAWHRVECRGVTRVGHRCLGVQGGSGAWLRGSKRGDGVSCQGRGHRVRGYRRTPLRPASVGLRTKRPALRMWVAAVSSLRTQQGGHRRGCRSFLGSWERSGCGLLAAPRETSQAAGGKPAPGYPLPPPLRVESLGLSPG